MARINVYAEEMSEDVEIISKEIEGQKFTGLRLYLYLPVTLPDGTQARGKFMHHPGDDDSAAITFWGKRVLRVVLRKMLAKLDEHYGDGPARDMERGLLFGSGVSQAEILVLTAKEKGIDLEPFAKELAKVIDDLATRVCLGCGQYLKPTNLTVADGCPCNSRRGVNHGRVPRETCTCAECDPVQTGSSRYKPR